MATVPNYYYNSPWIAEAARNLASAFAPEDRDKLARREQSAWEFQHAKSEAQYTDTKRQNQQLADVEVQGLLEMSPILGGDGKIDEDATEAEARRRMGKIIELGGDDYWKIADHAAGTASPTYAAKSAARQQTIDANRYNMYAGFGNALTMQGNQFANQRLILEDTQDFEREENAKKLDAAWNREVARLQSDAEIANARIKAAGNNAAPVVFGQFQKDITRGILQKVQDSGMTISRKNLDGLYALAGQYGQQMRSAQLGVNMAWEETVEKPLREKGGQVPSTGAGTINAPGRWARAFSSGDDLDKRILRPVFPGQELVIDEPARKFSDPLNPQPDATPTPLLQPTGPGATQPPAATNKPSKGGKKTPPEGARSKDKKGNPIIYKNGRWEYP